MKNYVVILAGGVGSRVGEAVPKQFLMLNDKPVIAHTISNFQQNENVDTILIVCIKNWIDYLGSVVTKYNLTKVKWIVEGGETVYESIRNGIFPLRDKIEDEDYIIIHDAARPILPQMAINEMLRVAYEKGNASLAIPCYLRLAEKYKLHQTGGSDFHGEKVKPDVELARWPLEIEWLMDT